jgi:hypothetical protein
MNLQIQFIEGKLQENGFYVYDMSKILLPVVMGCLLKKRGGHPLGFKDGTPIGFEAGIHIAFKYDNYRSSEIIIVRQHDLWATGRILFHELCHAAIWLFMLPRRWNDWLDR